MLRARYTTIAPRATQLQMRDRELGLRETTPSRLACPPPNRGVAGRDLLGRRDVGVGPSRSRPAVRSERPARAPFSAPGLRSAGFLTGSSVIARFVKPWPDVVRPFRPARRHEEHRVFGAVAFGQDLVEARRVRRGRRARPSALRIDCPLVRFLRRRRTSRSAPSPGSRCCRAGRRVSQTLPPMVEPRPMAMRPRMVAPA